MRGDNGVMKEDCQLFEFDELLKGTQEDCIHNWMKTETAREMAIDDCRHMKFNANGAILRGYDEL